jgi:hypothetical protein
VFKSINVRRIMVILEESCRLTVKAKISNFLTSI